MILNSVLFNKLYSVKCFTVVTGNMDCNIYHNGFTGILRPELIWLWRCDLFYPQVEFGKHDVPVFELDVGRISDAFHGSLDPSILSLFQEKTSTDSVESEASLLSALTEMLDSVDVETLSPFDTLPDAEIFSARKGSDRTVSGHVSIYVTRAGKTSSNWAHGRNGSYLIVCDKPVIILLIIRISLPAIIQIKPSCWHTLYCQKYWHPF